MALQPHLQIRKPRESSTARTPRASRAAHRTIQWSYLVAIDCQKNNEAHGDDQNVQEKTKQFELVVVLTLYQYLVQYLYIIVLAYIYIF